MNYEINEGTLAILAKNKKSLILEDDKKYVVDSLPFDVVDHSCKYFGSSYEGRREGTKEILHINYKVPIIVDNSRNLIFFPTNSPISDDCSWLSLKSIKSIKEGDFNTTDVIFNNGVSINIPVSKRTMDNQILRASRLDLIMRNRNA